MVNCALAGTCRGMRISPLPTSRLWAAAPSPGTALGQLAPSNAANSGSVPPLLANRACASAALRLHASPARWQVPHERPFVPRLWKNGLPVSRDPLLLNVATVPLGSANGNRLPIRSAANSGRLAGATGVAWSQARMAEAARSAEIGSSCLALGHMVVFRSCGSGGVPVRFAYVSTDAFPLRVVSVPRAFLR